MTAQKTRFMLKREWLVVIPLLSVLLILPFWQVATMQGIVITNDIAISDMANLSHPLRHFLGRELQQGRLPLWSPDIYMGYPLQAEGMMGGFYPPNLLLFGLLPPLAALNLSVLLPFFVAAFATYTLARKLGAAIWPALVAAVAYALGGFYIAHTKQMSIVHAACWIPLVWLVIELGLDQDRRLLLLVGVLWAVQWLTGMPQIAYYSVGTGLLYYLGRAIQTRQLRRTAAFLVLGLIFSFGLAAVQLLPTAELTGFSERGGGVSFEFASSFRYRLESMRTFLYPYANGDPGTASYQIQGLFWEDYAYIGLIPLVSGLVGGLWLARKPGPARPLLALAGATFLVALGKNTPVFRLAYDWLPGMDYFRFPQRLQAVTTLCLVLTAALFLTELQAWLTRGREQGAAGSRDSRLLPRGETLLGIGILSLVVADLYFYQIRQNAIVDAQTWYAPPETARRIHQETPASDRDGDVGLYRVFTVGGVITFHEAYEQAGGWEGDLEPYVAQREYLQPSLNILYDLPSADGYANLTPAWLTQVWGNEKQPGFVEHLIGRSGDRLVARDGFARLLSLFNVRYLITHLPFQEEGFEPLGVYGPGAYLYENRNVWPRAFAVPTYSLASDVTAALNYMVSPGFDPTREVVLHAAPTEHGGASHPDSFTSQVKITRFEPLQVTIEAETNQPGFLVLSDLYYPGWEVQVDGQPASIYQANACVRAVPLKEGLHRVDFFFKPKPLRYGALVSGLSALALILVYRLSKR
jgi:hypothetical protein